MSKFYPYVPGATDGLPRFREEQERHIQRMMEEPTKAVLQASSMGAGKTGLVCEFLVRMGFTRSLIIGVKDTYAQWAGRLDLQSDGRIALRRIDSTKAGKQAMADFLAGEDGFFFAGIQYVTAQDWVHAPLLDDEGRKVPKIKKTTGEQVTKLSTHIGPRLIPEFVTERTHVKVYKKMRVPVQALIVDEVHNYAGRTTIGLRTLRTIPAEWKVGMSGTFYRNRFEGAWSVTSWLWPDLIDTRFSRWVDEHCVVDVPRKKNGQPVTDGRGAPVKQIMGEKVPGRFVASLPCYLRIDAERQVPEPELFRVELVAEQREMYRSLEEEGMAWLRAHGVMEPLVTLLPIDKRIRLRQATLGTMTLDQFGRVRFADDTQSMKLWALKQIVDRPDWTGRQVMVYTESKQFAFVAAKRMAAAGYRVGVWTGDASSKERDGLKEQFLTGQIQYLVAVISSFSTGLDGFQAVCNRVVWLSEDESNTENLQGIKRVFRSGDEVMLDDFQHVKIIANGTYDEGVFLGNTAHAAELAVSMAA